MSQVFHAVLECMYICVHENVLLMCCVSSHRKLASRSCACVYAHTRVHVHGRATCSLSHVCVYVRVCVCVCTYIMLLLTCFSYNFNLFKHFFLFLFLNSFVHSHVTLMVCFKANFLLRTFITIKYYMQACTHTHTHTHTFNFLFDRHYIQLACN